MNTLVLNIPPDEFVTLLDGSKVFVVMHVKKNPPQVGQRALLVNELFNGEEIETKVTNVHTAPGLMKGNIIVSFEHKQSEPPVLQFAPMLEVGSEGMNDISK